MEAKKRREILVVGLGPDDGSLLTLAGLRAMQDAGRLILRTERHGVAEALRQEGILFETMDDLYAASEDFDPRDSLSAEELTRLCKAAPVASASDTNRAVNKNDITA